MQGQYTKHTTNDLTRAQMKVNLEEEVPLARAAADFKATEGVAKIYAFDDGYVADRRDNAENTAGVTIADCASLREVASLPSCKDGDVLRRPGWRIREATPGMSKPGSTLWFDYFDGDPGVVHRPTPWTVPADVKQARSIAGPGRERARRPADHAGRAARGAVHGLRGQIYLALDQSVADARDYVRNTAAPSRTRWPTR